MKETLIFKLIFKYCLWVYFWWN